MDVLVLPAYASRRAVPPVAQSVGTSRYLPSMPRSATVTAFQCSVCGWRTTKWAGRCGDCDAWGTVIEAPGEDPGRAGSRVQLRAAQTRPAQPATAAVPIGDVDAAAAKAGPTGMSELDRVLGGGLVPGAVVLLAGEPGVGKSTLLLEAGALAAASGRVLYVTGEESAAQVRLRADRIGAISDSLYLAAETDFGALLGHVQAVDPALLIVDSIQTICAAGVDGVPGGVTQVREITAALTALAKQRTLTTVLVGHVTKDGSVAGPRTLEHLVDVVLHFDGDSRGQLRMVRALKNRYGPTDEFGCFELGEFGLTGLPDPSGLFLSERHEPVPGTCVTVTLEGRRPLLAEVQTLVCDTAGDLPPRRVVSGLDSARVGMMLAVLQRRAGLGIGKRDVFAATVGGVRLTEPSVDLAVGLAVASAVADLSVPPDLVAIGEVGLAGEIRRVTGIQRRLTEAERMGFRRAIIPAGSGLPPAIGPSRPRRGDGTRTSHLHVAGPQQWVGSLAVMEVADMQSAIAAALGRR
jgi:DNA repair protein RadA/Sms